MQKAPAVSPAGAFAFDTRSKPLLGAIHAVTRIAEAGHDITLLVEMAVDGRREHRHVRMGFGEMLDAFGGCEQADEAYIARAAFLQLVDSDVDELPVASIGSTTMVRRSDRSAGALK